MTNSNEFCLYIYDVNTLNTVAVAQGESNKECEELASAYLGMDQYGAIYDDTELNHDWNTIEQL